MGGDTRDVHFLKELINGSYILKSIEMNKDKTKNKSIIAWATQQHQFWSTVVPIDGTVVYKSMSNAIRSAFNDFYYWTALHKWTVGPFSMTFSVILIAFTVTLGSVIVTAVSAQSCHLRELDLCAATLLVFTQNPTGESHPKFPWKSIMFNWFFNQLI